MSKKKTISAIPTAGELDVLSVLWKAEAPMRLGEVRDALNDFFESMDEPLLASSSVSTFLRRLVDKGLVQEAAAKTGKPRGAVRVRGMVGRRQTPNLQYEAACAPTEVLESTFKTLIASYPEDDQTAGRPLVDFARAMGLKEDKIREIKKLL